MKHTEGVVCATIEMAAHYKLSEEDYFIVVSAAYFHDLGCMNGGSQDHEIRSAKLAGEFLSKDDVPEHVIQKIEACILSTKMPQSPSNLLESILCDADLHHLGSEDFREKSKLMHSEIENTHNKKVGKGLWRRMTILLMQEHKYHTDFAKEKLEKTKKKNLETLIQEEKKSKEKDKNSIAKKPERGIETMFRRDCLTNCVNLKIWSSVV